MERIRSSLESPAWSEFWLHLNVPLLSFEDVGLNEDSKDEDVWDLCQQSQWVLITGNRNSKGSDSLGQTIRRKNRPESLPVITVADPDLVMKSGTYVERVTEKVLEFLLAIENIRGSGRLFVP